MFLAIVIIVIGVVLIAVVASDHLPDLSLSDYPQIRNRDIPKLEGFKQSMIIVLEQVLQYSEVSPEEELTSQFNQGLYEKSAGLEKIIQEGLVFSKAFVFYDGQDILLKDHPTLPFDPYVYHNVDLINTVYGWYSRTKHTP